MKHVRQFFAFLFDHLEYIFIVILFVGIFYLAFNQGSYTKAYESRLDDPNYYVNKIFDDSYVHRIDVEISEQDFANLQADPGEKHKYRTDVTIDGETFHDVAFSVRGNGSINTIKEYGEYKRYNYTLNFNTFTDKNFSYHGLDKLILNGLYYEPSYLRSALAFRLIASVTKDVPLSSFTKLYVNGELKGVYLTVEAVDRSFLDRIGVSPNSAMFHPVPYDVDADRIRDDSRYLTANEELNVFIHPDSSQNTYGGADLVYRGEERDAYNSIFLNASTKYAPADERLIISGIESLSEFSLADVTDYWDMDSVLRFFAASALVPNDDSYLGGLAQNYYLITSRDKISIISWDYDRAFSLDGFIPQSAIDEEMVGWPIDEPVFSTTVAERPLFRIVAENEEYLARYHNILQETLDRYIFSGDARREFDTLVEQIRPYVYADSSRLYTTDDFENEVNYLRAFILLRADSIQKQLWGLEPSTRKEFEESEELEEF